PIQKRPKPTHAIGVHLADVQVKRMRDVHEGRGERKPGLRPLPMALFSLIDHRHDLGLELRHALPAVSLTRPNIRPDKRFHHALAICRCIRLAASRWRCASVCRSAMFGLMKFCTMLAPALTSWAGVMLPLLFPV